MNKKKINLTSLIFMALCCDMGIIAKKLIAPAANEITEYLHIPGGTRITLVSYSKLLTKPVKWAFFRIIPFPIRSNWVVKVIFVVQNTIFFYKAIVLDLRLLLHRCKP